MDTETHVSGTIAGKGNNGLGVTGVAWDAKIMPLKFLSDGGSGYTSKAILAINYATTKGVKLTNNSWGGGGYSQALSDAINTAGQQGALFIAAAGNSSLNTDTTPSYPASYNLSNIISVASTTRTDGLSSFSNYGATTVDLGAPGSSIYSTWPNSTYNTISGTSMASPHVTGAAALLWSQNPTWTAQQVKNKLLQTTDPISALSGKTVSGGRLNINNALVGSTPAPSNDHFVNRILLYNLPVSTTGSNVGATGETGEPLQSETINSVWWSWTAPSSGTFTIDTKNSNFDTYLSVFTGSAVNNLSLIDSNDDGGGSYTSLISLNATAGKTYQIAVDGFQAATGSIQLNIAAPDTTPPTASSFTPADNATGVAVAADLVVNFSEAIQKGTGNIVIKQLSDDSVVETIAVTASNVILNGNQLTINPTANLVTGIDYYIEIANGAIKDIAGNNYLGITGNSTWNFKTQEFPPINGTPNNDILTGTANPEIINGLGGNDKLSGLGGNDSLNGGAGIDTLDGGAGNDILKGNTGNDIYIVGTGDIVTELANQGTDLVQSAISYTLPANVENLTLTGTTAINGTGNTLANIITGNTANNTLNGGDGNDSLRGGAANDALTGGLGADKFIYNTNAVFTTSAVGVDTITDFNISETDQIVLDKTTFTSISSAAGNWIFCRQ
ncbi:MAG: S8 family serine peptidase [Planktothrix sp. GU0601_MAG3]|nr:MAG: S8 family serine peptidase [Planktothrix sp. GU0601_MAG3]